MTGYTARPSLQAQERLSSTGKGHVGTTAYG
jgi:hypothetical protein